MLHMCVVLQQYLDTTTLLVEVKQIDLPQDRQRAIAKQAEAEHERWAKVINAEGEFQVAQRWADAALILAQHPVAFQLRLPPDLHPSRDGE